MDRNKSKEFCRDKQSHLVEVKTRTIQLEVAAMLPFDNNGTGTYWLGGIKDNASVVFFRITDFIIIIF